MAATRLTNVIVPEVFTPYTIQRSQTVSELYNSGIITTSPSLNALVAGGGSTFNLPFFNDLSGDSEIIEDNTSLTVNNLTTERQIGVALNRAKSFGSSFLAQYVSGEDPMRVIGDLVGDYWAREEQKIVINILKALFGTAGPITGTHCSDQSAQSALTNSMLVDTIALIGDAYNKLSTIVCHSQIFHSLRKLDLIQYVEVPSALPMTFPQYMGLNLIVDDGVETSGAGAAKVYTTYIFASGAVSYGSASLDPADATEVDRDSLKSEDVLINRRRCLYHPNGFKWTGSPSGSSPTNTELATPGNWTKVFEDKNIPIVALKSKV